jgi:hypothetical protein
LCERIEQIRVLSRSDVDGLERVRVSFETAYDRSELDGLWARAKEGEHFFARRGGGSPCSKQSQPVEPGYCRCAGTHDWGTFAREVFPVYTFRDCGVWALELDGHPLTIK